MSKNPAQENPKAIVPYDYSGDAGVGTENVRSDDLSIPFLMMLQSLSPEVNKSNPKHLLKGIVGAESGHIIDSVTRVILNPKVGTGAGDGDKVKFVPCSYQKAYVEWTPRNQGGGIVSTHLDQSILSKTKKNEKGQDVLPNGNLIVTTAYFFGFYIDKDGERHRVVLSMTSTQLKKARAWLTQATSIRFAAPDGTKFNPPLFSHYYNLSAVPESNDDGSWHGWKVEMGGRIDDPLLIDYSRSLTQDIKSGQARIGQNAAPEAEDI